MATHTAMAQGSNAGLRNSLEQRLGITQFVAPKERGWHGQSRTRFTDFQVHEITKEGEVLHLTDYPMHARDLPKTVPLLQTTSSSASQSSKPAKPTQSQDSKGAAQDNSATGGSVPTEGSAPTNGSTPVEGDVSNGGNAPIEGSAPTDGSTPVEGNLSNEGNAPIDGSASSGGAVLTKGVGSDVKDTERPALGADQPMGDQGSVMVIPRSDETALVNILGQAAAQDLIAFFEKMKNNPRAPLKSHGEVKLPPIDRSLRSQIHSEIRRIFGGKIDTATDAEGCIKARAVGGGRQQWGNRSRNDRSRNNHQSNTDRAIKTPYIHFSLYKENRDTMDALNHMGKVLKVFAKDFGSAGTKDRRAVTVQRVSVRSRNLPQLVGLNTKVHGIKIGDFKLAQGPITLNSHGGNEFVIVMKNCSFNGTDDLNFEQKLEVAKSTLDSALAQMVQHGFINYYGTQRFGTHQIGTQEVGIKILQDDFEGAVKALLSFDPNLLDVSDQGQSAFRRDDINRARACSTILKTGDHQAALKHLPQRCHVEMRLINHIGRNPTDFRGAIQTINKTMRTMYVHAYQSLVWNFVASKRWELFGPNVVKGDLVLIKPDAPMPMVVDDEEKNAEETIHLEADADSEGTKGLVAHVLTEDDVNSGKYSIFDIVLPTPGWDVVYPPNEVGAFYAEFMRKGENGGLDPHDMRRRQRDFSLPGNYRKLMGKLLRSPSASVQAYSNDLDQLVPTDLDLVRSRKVKEAAEGQARRIEEMTTRDATQQKVTSAWQSFGQNVQQNEREESRARFARRKAEELPPPPPVRTSDTWVQTALDGSSKRVKIARHTDTIEPEMQTAVQPMDGDAMQTDSEESNKKQVDQADTAEKASQTSVDADQSGSSIVATINTQVRAFANRLMNAIYQMMAALRITTDVDLPKPGPATSQDEPQPELQTLIEAGNNTAQPPSGTSTDKTAQTNSSHGAVSTAIKTGHTNTTNVDQPQSNEAAQPSGVAVGESSPAQVQPSTSPDLTTKQKIAVVLRFALDTSQYATIVVRELQGAALQTDEMDVDVPTTSKDDAPSTNSTLASEGATNLNLS
ncbi:Uu.00g005540.m01.CDS01 [Anthostomella pinea]|uniref:Uu.00g005540.m01.CDS01 n=1 Tax=Anthostomella pinea TaxID=933095 RepID=A0AAI8VK67_9PEZI|nr:Uu.00g005540.m01.CDS01 [Anthostomella pinea]